MLVCNTLYNDKGYGDRSLIFFTYDTGQPVFVGRIDNVSDETITNILNFDENKLVVVGLPGQMRIIESAQQSPDENWL